MLALWLLLPAQAWDLRTIDDQRTGGVVVAAEVFPISEPDWASAGVVTDPAGLAAVATDALAYLQTMAGNDPAADAGMFEELGVSPTAMEKTLELVIQTATTAPELLSDPAWLNQHFTLYRWTPPASETRVAKFGLAPGTIRITRYLTTKMTGAPTQDAGHPEALYADPGELRTAYTRAQVMQGAYDPGGKSAGQAQPLVWLTEANVHDAIMQGSVEVTLPDGSRHVYGVETSNGIPYDPKKKERGQDRYWYFSELPAGPKGYGPTGSPHIHLRPGVSVAGDIFNLGLGALIVLEHDNSRGGKTLRLAILADTGGAFQPNLAQLDWYGGAFATHAELYERWATLPEHVRAGVLIAR